MSDLNDSAFKCLWQQQPTEELNMTLDDIRSKAMNFHGTTRINNAIQYGVFVLLIVANGVLIFQERDRATKVAFFAFLIVATLFVAYYLYKKGHAAALPIDGDTRTYLKYLSTELIRQRQLQHAFFYWNIAPFIPAFVFGAVLLAVDHPSLLTSYLALLLIGFVSVYLVTQKAARRLQSRVEQTETAMKAIDNGQVHD